MVDTALAGNYNKASFPSLSSLLRSKWQTAEVAEVSKVGSFTRELDKGHLLLVTLERNDVKLGALTDSGYWELLVDGSALIAHFADALGLSGGDLGSLAELFDDAIRRPGVSLTVNNGKAVFTVEYCVGSPQQLLKGAWELPLVQCALAPALAASMKAHLLARAQGVPDFNVAAGKEGDTDATAAAAVADTEKAAPKSVHGVKGKRRAGAGMSALNPNVKQPRTAKGATFKSSSSTTATNTTTTSNV